MLFQILKIEKWKLGRKKNFNKQTWDKEKKKKKKKRKKELKIEMSWEIAK